MKFTEEHEWLRSEGDIVVVGITEHLTFLDSGHFSNSMVKNFSTLFKKVFLEDWI